MKYYAVQCLEKIEPQELAARISSLAGVEDAEGWTLDQEGLVALRVECLLVMLEDESRWPGTCELGVLAVVMNKFVAVKKEMKLKKKQLLEQQAGATRQALLDAYKTWK